MNTIKMIAALAMNDLKWALAIGSITLLTVIGVICAYYDPLYGSLGFGSGVFIGSLMAGILEFIDMMNEIDSRNKNSDTAQKL